MKSARQIVFHYNGNPATDDVIVDLHGEEFIPAQGTVIARKGKQWKVVMVATERLVIAPQAIPVHRVYLTHQV
jgi:hypothetical protein